MLGTVSDDVNEKSVLILNLVDNNTVSVGKRYFIHELVQSSGHIF